jgi:hypothetical protein
MVDIWDELEPIVNEMIKKGKTKDEILKVLVQAKRTRKSRTNSRAGLVGPNVWLKQTLKSIPK